MGIRSDVGIAVKSEFGKGFEEKAKEVNLDLDWATKYENPEGTLYVFNDIKWYRNDSDYPCDAIQEYLESLGEENYKLVESCPEYPDTGENCGSWDENPWNLSKVVKVELSFINP